MKNNISRAQFLSVGSLAMAGLWYSQGIWAMGTKLADKKSDKLLISRFLEANDQSVESLLNEEKLSSSTRFSSYRSVARNISVMAASFSHKDSDFYRSQPVLEALQLYADILLKGQYEDGTLDSGGNRQSPPDTAFVLEHVCGAMSVLKKDNFKNTNILTKSIEKFILNAGEAMVTGGVHTPNHRWVVCAAIAGIYELYPDEKYVNRIEQWLAEGVYTNNDGHYLERSANYSAVINRALITIAKTLQRPALLDSVLKNLITYCYYTEPNGDVVSIDSRRQDQLRPSTITKFYVQYRYMALRTKNPLLVYMTKQIEGFADFDSVILSRSLIEFMIEPELGYELPKSNLVFEEYEKMFSSSHLVRIKRGNITMTLFGGIDRPLEIVSGKSSNPNFLTYRKGAVILKHMRLSTSFFRMGYFRSEGITKQGTSYKLHEKKEAYYYQPLEKQYHLDNGDYKLSESHDKRFWNKMDFDSRKKSNVKTQVTDITLIEQNGELNIDIKVDGPPHVEVTLEMCFEKGGTLTGTTTLDTDKHLLKSGFGMYQVGEDQITFGPGLYVHDRVSRLESEQYGYHNGTLQTDGEHVYITGITPFAHSLTLS
ncbi:hypothetical protein Q2T41_01550 [Maribacter confluentis]|uniref:Heparinase II/III-like protein n=1 Tax=Maribacter confluentis TaxID=1656093 RepID=A0ABT8RLB0_9FLAO|nr:hypothetical protein [Maribacter confluentis]MDO1511348.1 hypothetical protein [Maribacter confluentis]